MIYITFKRRLLLIISIIITNTLFSQQPRLILPVGHSYDIMSVQYSPDGKKILTTSMDHTAKMWDAASGYLLTDFRQHRSWVNMAAFSPDGRKLVTASGDSTAIVWDAVRGQVLKTLRHQSRVEHVAFSPDGKKILSITQSRQYTFWDTEKGTIIPDFLPVEEGKAEDVRFSPDGKYVLTRIDGMVQVWDVFRKAHVADLGINAMGPNIVSACFSKDGKKILAAADSGSVFLWDINRKVTIKDEEGYPVETLRANRIIKHSTDRFTDAQFSPAEDRVYTKSLDQKVGIWQTATGKQLAELPVYTDERSFVQISPNGKILLTANDFESPMLWDAFTGKLLDSCNLEKGVMESGIAAFSPDGSKIISATDYYVSILDGNTGKLQGILNDRQQLATNTQRAVISKDGSKFISLNGGGINIWSEAEGRILYSQLDPEQNIRDADFSPLGNKVVTLSADSMISVLDLTSGGLIYRVPSHSESVSSAFFSFSPDEKLFASIEGSRALVRDAVTGVFINQLEPGPDSVKLEEIFFSHDGKKIAATGGNFIKIWDVHTGKILRQIKGTAGKFNKVVFNPSGDEMLINEGWDSKARVVNIVTGQTLFYLTGHVRDINTLQYSANGKFIVSASDDHTAKVWSASDGKMIHDLKGHNGTVTSAAFNADGSRVFTVSWDQSVKVWETGSGKLVDQWVDSNSHPHIICAGYGSGEKRFLIFYSDNTVKIWDTQRHRILYSLVLFGKTDYLVLDNKSRFDGTAEARKLLYFTCDEEIIDLDQLKDQLWVPNLAGRILEGDSIHAKSISELNICGLTPLTEMTGNTATDYRFKIIPRRGGLGETVLYVNDIEAGRFKTSQLIPYKGYYELVVKKSDLHNYFIPGQQNLVKVKAYTSDNTISSRGTGTRDRSAREKAPPPNLFAVMVGVSDYKDETLDLKYAAKDARDLSIAVGAASRKLLNSDKEEHVFIYDLTTLRDRYLLPEKNSIRKTLEEIGKKATANDILLLFFAGHGKMDPVTKQFYFLSADASGATSVAALSAVGISTTELTEWIKPQHIRAQKRVLIFDACHSGQAIREIVKLGNPEQGFVAARGDEQGQQIKAIEKLNEQSGLFILAASASDQEAYEMGRYSQGLLTYALLKAIKEQPDILEDGKYLNLNRWFHAAEKTVSEISKSTAARQQPQVVSTTNFNIGLVDEDVTALITLPREKPVFTASNFQNSDETIAFDDLELSKLVNYQLSQIAARGEAGNIIFGMATNSPDACSIGGRYHVKDNTVTVRISIRQNKELKHQFEMSGTKDKLRELAASISEKAALLVQ